MTEQMIRKNNMKIYPFYKLFAWDLLFYYAIVYLFLTQIKDISASQVLLIDSFYGMFRIVFQIPCVCVVDYLGKQKSLLLGNIFVSISILLLIIGNSFIVLIFLHLIQAIGYNLKSICEPTLLSDSIPESSAASKIFSKIDGKGSSYYYMFNAISSIATGFLYVLNPYIPIIMCFIACLISTIISISFMEPPIKKIQKSANFISYYKDLISTFKHISKSNRLKSLLIFSLFFRGILYLFITLRSSLLVSICMPEQYFGIILAVVQIASSISAMKQDWFHKKLKNRVLTYFSLSITIAFIITGILIICNINSTVSFIASLTTIVLVGFIKAPYFTLIQKYLNNFSNPHVNTKIFAINILLENLGRITLSLFASLLLGFTTISYSLIIIGLLFFIIFAFLLNYMKTKVGLKPEEYPPEDLIFTNIK